MSWRMFDYSIVVYSYSVKSFILKDKRILVIKEWIPSSIDLRL